MTQPALVPPPIPVPAPPAPLPPAITRVLNTVLHYDVLAAGTIMALASSPLAASLPHAPDYAKWVLYALAALAACLKIFGAQITPIATAIFFAVMLSMGLDACSASQQQTESAVTMRALDKVCSAYAAYELDAGHADGQ